MGRQVKRYLNRQKLIHKQRTDNLSKLRHKPIHSLTKYSKKIKNFKTPKFHLSQLQQTREILCLIHHLRTANDTRKHIPKS